MACGCRKKTNQKNGPKMFQPLRARQASSIHVSTDIYNYRKKTCESCEFNSKNSNNRPQVLILDICQKNKMRISSWISKIDWHCPIDKF